MARKGHRPSKAPAGRPRFWGKHAVGAALANPERTVRKILAELIPLVEQAQAPGASSTTQRPPL